MKLRLPLAAFAALWCMVVCAAATEALGDETRANATVKAVRKVKPSVVAIKVPGASASSKGTVGTGVIIDERGYIAVVCAACRRLHLVNGQTGKALGENQA